MNKTIKKAVYEVSDPMMETSKIIDGRGCLKHPAVVWSRVHGKWERCSPVVELSVAKRLGKQFSGKWVVSITPAVQISKTLQLPSF